MLPPGSNPAVRRAMAQGKNKIPHESNPVKPIVVLTTLLHYRWHNRGFHLILQP